MNFWELSFDGRDRASITTCIFDREMAGKLIKVLTDYKCKYQEAYAVYEGAVQLADYHEFVEIDMYLELIVARL